jgi:hypothetical protein
MIPAWKLRREWARFKQQLAAIPEHFTEPAARRRHDQAFAAGFPRHDGAIQEQGKVAIFLVFQPDGISYSTLLTCDQLRNAGYTPFVVSNAPLSDDDKARLHPHVWRILERPNFGYDMGGYRDGIRQLIEWEISPERLLIVNDSIWFPTLEQDGLIAALEAVDADLSGTILRERGQERFLESYLFHIPRHLFESAEFRTFWDEFQITSNKYKVIRRGERGFSAAMRAAGKTVRGLFPVPDFLEKLAAQDTEFLRKTIAYTAHNYEEYEAARQALLANPDAEDWRQQALDHVAQSLPRENIYSAFPFAMVHLNRYPILKKSNDRVAILWRRAYLSAVRNGDIPQPPAPIWAELQAKCSVDQST